MDRRFVKRLPNSAAGPSYKLTLPHQVVNKYLMHLVDADLELASSATAKQVWHGSIAPRRNKERSEFTLQGWRLFAEAHKMQAGDQVAFELVGERRLVAQIIKSADPGQYPPMSSSQRQKSAQDRKRKAQIACFARPSYRPCMEMQEAQVPDVDFAGSRPAFEEISGLHDGEKWKEFSEGLSCGGSSGDCTRIDSEFLAYSQPSKGQQVPEWVSEEPFIPLAQEPMHDLQNRSSFDSSRSPTHRSQSRSPSAEMQHADLELAYNAACLPSFQDLLQDETAIAEAVVPTQGLESMATLHEPEFHVGTQLSDLSCTIQSLQKQSQAARTQADKANLRARGMKLKLESLQSSLDQHSRQALRAAVSLEKHSASFPTDCQSVISGLLSQLKGSLSQLLVLSMGEGHENSPPAMRPQQLDGVPTAHCYI